MYYGLRRAEKGRDSGPVWWLGASRARFKGIQTRDFHVAWSFFARTTLVTVWGALRVVVANYLIR